MSVEMIVALCAVLALLGIAGCVHVAFDSRAMVPTPFLMFVLAEVAITLPATFLALADGNDLFLVQLVALLVLLTAYACVRAASGQRHLADRFAKARMPTEGLELRVSLLLVAGGVMLSILFFQGLPPLTRFLDAVLSPGPSPEAISNLNVVRRELTKGHLAGGGYRGQGLFEAISEVLWPAAAVFSCLNWARKRSWQSLVAFVLVGLVAATYAGGTGRRLPIIMVALAIGLAYSLFRPLRIRHLVATLGLLVAVLVIVAPLSSTYLSNDGGRVSVIAERAFLGNGINNVRLNEAMADDAVQLGYGKHLYTKVVTAFPGVQSDEILALDINRYRSDVSNDLSFSSPTFFGFIYADFGGIGTLIVYAMVGALLAAVYERLFEPQHTAWRVALISLVLLFTFDAVNSSPVATVISLSLMVALLKTLRLLLHVPDASGADAPPIASSP